MGWYASYNSVDFPRLEDEETERIKRPNRQLYSIGVREESVGVGPEWGKSRDDADAMLTSPESADSASSTATILSAPFQHKISRLSSLSLCSTLSDQ